MSMTLLKSKYLEFIRENPKDALKGTSLCLASYPENMCKVGIIQD